MNVLFYIIAAAVLFALSSRIYARYIARSLGEDDNNPTPAQVLMTAGIMCRPGSR